MMPEIPFNKMIKTLLGLQKENMKLQKLGPGRIGIRGSTIHRWPMILGGGFAGGYVMATKDNDYMTDLNLYIYIDYIYHLKWI